MKSREETTGASVVRVQSRRTRWHSRRASQRKPCQGLGPTPAACSSIRTRLRALQLDLLLLLQRDPGDALGREGDPECELRLAGGFQLLERLALGLDLELVGASLARRDLDALDRRLLLAHDRL